ncbi:MAG: Ig-like domain-containing protein [Butyrivibrio sp.]|nr:Ig-like domain-containing protein [Butyrivibrio sp.]
MKIKNILGLGVIAYCIVLGSFPATAYAAQVLPDIDSSSDISEADDSNDNTSLAEETGDSENSDNYESSENNESIEDNEASENNEASDTIESSDSNESSDTDESTDLNSYSDNSKTLDILTSSEEEKVAIESVELDERILILQQGQEAQITATVYPEDAYDTNIYYYTSSDESVAIVDESGNITALSTGCVTITAYAADDVSRECIVTVYPDGDLDEIAESQDNWTFKMFYKAVSNLNGKSSPWEKVLFIGDSVTQGIQSGSSKSEWIPNYPITFGSVLDTEVENGGIGGSAVWSRSDLPLINYVDDYGDADAVFIMAGYNDWFYGTQCPMGDLETENTFTYDLNALYSKIEEKYDGADIFVILPPTPHSHSGYEEYYDFSWIRGIEREVAELHDFYLINLPAEDILNGLEDDTYETFFSDGVHLNDYGYTVLGTIVADKAITIKNESDEEYTEYENNDENIENSSESVDNNEESDSSSNS